MTSHNKLKISFILFLLVAVCMAPAVTAQSKNRRDAANADMKKALHLRKPHLGFIKECFKNKNYDKVENLFVKLQEKYNEDPIYESPFLRGLEQFTSENGVSVEDLDAWVKEKESAMAYAARGIFYAQEGALARGTKFVKDTDPANFEKMHQYNVIAFEDLLIATTKDPKLMPAYVWMMGIFKTVGDRPSAEMVLRRALEYDNRTLYVRLQFMSVLTPRWGGSYTLMKQFAEECSQLADINPRLWSFLGDIDDDRGRVYLYRKQYEKAIECFNASLKYGDSPEVLNARAACYYALGDYEKAIEDYELTLQYSPSDSQALKWSGIAKFRKSEEN